MSLENWVIIGIIVLLSFDTTLFLQSLISQPIVSCQIIGFIVGNYELGLMIGAASQLAFLSYLPIGGAKIPDPQIAPNLVLLVLRDEHASLELVGHWLPIIILLSIIFMISCNFERLISTWYMKYIPYRFLKIEMLFSASFFLHLCLTYYLIYSIYKVVAAEYATITNYFIFDGTHAYYFVVLYALGNLFIRYKKWGINGKSH